MGRKVGGRESGPRLAWMQMEKMATILIVDDEADLRDAIAFDFHRKGFRALVASGGRAAALLLEFTEVDLIITDLNMPEGGGLELVNLLRERGSMVPVVMFISDDSMTESEALARGISAVFSKPFCTKELVETVQKLIG